MSGSLYQFPLHKLELWTKGHWIMSTLPEVKKAGMKFCLSIFILHSTFFSKSVLNNWIRLSFNPLIFYLGFIVSSNCFSTQHPIWVTFFGHWILLHDVVHEMNWNIYFLLHFFNIYLKVIKLVYNFWTIGLENKASCWLFIFGKQFLFSQ